MADEQHLITGGDDHFLPHLLEAINHATEIELAVAFIRKTGLNLIFDALAEAVATNAERPTPRARLRIITTDYLDVTDPAALRSLLLLQERGAEVKVYEAGNKSFHRKAYIFVRSSNDGQVAGSAFVGSSNISQSALTTGLEWNYRIDCDGIADDGGGSRLEELRRRFNELFDAPQARSLDADWIERYARRRKPTAQPVVPGADETEDVPEPTEVQVSALEALARTREEGYRRGLVVMATGLGKTWLAAFDSRSINAKRILFVAHRQEILMQAEAAFLRVHPDMRVGHYNGDVKDESADALFASVQTLGREKHLERFPVDHFDYVVVDEFHHAAASTYRRLLQYFRPRFLLGLTATPERTDQSDILSLCDDNLVFGYSLFDGVNNRHLAPFHYYGVYDESVDYREIPWRSSKFDPELLSNKLATLSRARHVERQWRERGQSRTLAFCVSVRHAEFMAAKFNEWGIRSAAVHGGSTVRRNEGLALLESGRLQVVFSVELFNEGVDLPAIDTVMMLRPTESKIMFLQQLGRGLRLHETKEYLVVLDFIGNHQGFFNKPQALFQVGGTSRELAAFARAVESGTLNLPAGCFVNYDLALIEFLKHLDDNGPASEYEALKASLNRRPTLTEIYHAGVSLTNLRKQYGSWWNLVSEFGDLEEDEGSCLAEHADFFREVETTAMTKCFKMVVLESLLESEGFFKPLSLKALAGQALEVFKRRRKLTGDVIASLRKLDQVDPQAWLKYWKSNPINAWIGGNKKKAGKVWFEIENDHFVPAFQIAEAQREAFAAMLQELVDYRFSQYEPRLDPESDAGEGADNVVSVPFGVTELPFFPNIRIACGHFKTGYADAEEFRNISGAYGKLDPARHFIARASGESMNGGPNPIHDGDHLLLERVTPTSAGGLTGSVVAIERLDEAGDGQYLLRQVRKDPDGSYRFHATNPDYDDIVQPPLDSADPETHEEPLRPFARLRSVIDPLEMMLGESVMREDIPGLFGEGFNPGKWNVGHVVLNEKKAHILLVTINKQGKAKEHQYMDRFIDEETFHWQSQNSVSPDSKRGGEIVSHRNLGISVHLFVRDKRTTKAGKGAPFTYFGLVDYLSHEGSKPMSVKWRLVSRVSAEA